jgi:precorrin-3B synthase
MRQLLEVYPQRFRRWLSGLDIRRDAAVLTWRREQHRASWLGGCPRRRALPLALPRRKAA